MRFIRKYQRLRSLRLRRSLLPRPWAFYFPKANRWSKIVSHIRPTLSRSNDYLGIPEDLKGPFRSEVDCEEFCDHQNIRLHGGAMRFYSAQPVSKRAKASK